MIDPTVSVLIALAFAALFASAAAMKLRATAIFTATLADYRLVPRAFLPVTSVLVIVVELAVVIGLIGPTTRVMSAALGSGVMLLYGAAIAINLARGRHTIDCGCSLQRRPIGRWMVVRNLLFAAALSVPAAVPVAPRAFGAGDVATISAGLLVLALLYASLDLLLGRSPSPEHS